MSLKKLPKINAKAPASPVKWDFNVDALARWNSSVAFAGSDDSTISIYDSIGSDGWTDGVTAKRISAALRSIGSRDVTVSINSPGGDFFEGIAIYNLLREHPHKVTVKVVGLAASAASIIAMAGDDIQVAKSGFLMIHNAWAFAVGNKNDLRETATILDEFDGAMADIYASATGIATEDIVKMMDEETWLSGQSAVEKGFASSLLSADEIAENEHEDRNATAAIRKVDTMLARAGIARSERKSLLTEIKGGTPGAAVTVTPGADGVEEALNYLSQTIVRLREKWN